MKALVKTSMAEGLTMMQVPDPDEPGPTEVLIKVKTASICGSDVHIYRWDSWAQSRIKPPLIIGHEFSGIVEKVGEAVQTVKAGDYVACETHIPCLSCAQCRTNRMHVCRDMKILGVDVNGAFAEYVKVPQTVVWKLSKEIDPTFASVMEPFGNAVHTATVEDLTGKIVLISGVGPIGAMAIQVAKASGAAFIIASEIKEFRKSLALANGADIVIDPTKENLESRVMQLTDGNGVDVFLEMSGSVEALKQGLKVTTNGGAVSILGLYGKEVSINIDELITFKALRLFGITGRKMFETWYVADRLLKHKKVDLSKVVTHVIRFDEWKYGFELMMKGECGKVVMRL
ncbi:MAG: L-threonine 3-dehydrogenase [Pseudothermotoga sp.]|nr:L-threonine 3-dehydrogenase [Pseudothermotoga sp.]